MNSSNLKDKLIKIERTINVYAKDGDEPIEEVNIDIVPFEILKEIVPPTKEDPLLYDGYGLDEKQMNLINSYLQNRILADFKAYNYILVCGAIYDW